MRLFKPRIYTSSDLSNKRSTVCSRAFFQEAGIVAFSHQNLTSCKNFLTFREFAAFFRVHGLKNSSLGKPLFLYRNRASCLFIWWI